MKLRPQPECLITGVNFLDVKEHKWIRGDLHLLYDILIVNAAGCEWVYEPMNQEEKAVLSHSAYYEKAGQIVFPIAAAEFNLPANKYLNQTFNAEEEGNILIVNAAGLPRRDH